MLHTSLPFHEQIRLFVAISESVVSRQQSLRFLLEITWAAIAGLRGSQFRLPSTTPPALAHRAPSVLPRCSLDAPSMLPPKRPCSLSRTKTAISNPKFGVYIIYIYIHYTNPYIPLPTRRTPRFALERCTPSESWGVRLVG